MNSKIDKLTKRVDRLETATRPKGKGYIAVFKDPDQNGVFWERNPFSVDKGCQYSDDDLSGYDEVLIVEFARDWRGE